MLHSTTSSKSVTPAKSPQRIAPAQIKPGRGRVPGKPQRKAGKTKRTFGSQRGQMLMGSGQPQEIANSSENVLTEDFRSGNTAVQALVNHNIADTNSFVSNSAREREVFKKKAPELFEKFKGALLAYKAADSEAAQSMARGDVELVLNGAPTGLEDSVASLREKVLVLFRRSERRWAACRAARDLVLPNARELQRIAREYGISNPKQLRNYLSASLYYRPSSELLSHQAGQRSVAETLFQKGALG